MKLIKIELDETVIMGCLDFVEQFDTVPDAIERTLQAFTNAMRVKGKIPERTPEEAHHLVNATLLRATEEDDPLSVVDDMLKQLPPRSNDISSISTEAERRIEEDSVPNLGRPVTLIDRGDGDIAIVQHKVNLFEQHRKTFITLRREAPKDRLIEQMATMIVKWELLGDEPIPLSDKVTVAALEIVYTYLPRELWSSLKAEEQIKQFIGQHDGSET